MATIDIRLGSKKQVSSSVCVLAWVAVNIFKAVSLQTPGSDAARWASVQVRVAVVARLTLALLQVVVLLQAATAAAAACAAVRTKLSNSDNNSFISSLQVDDFCQKLTKEVIYKIHLS